MLVGTNRSCKIFMNASRQLLRQSAKADCKDSLLVLQIRLRLNTATGPSVMQGLDKASQKVHILVSKTVTWGMKRKTFAKMHPIFRMMQKHRLTRCQSVMTSPLQDISLCKGVARGNVHQADKLRNSIASYLQRISLCKLECVKPSSPSSTMHNAMTSTLDNMSV